MRRFSSYGPVDEERHSCVPRHDLIEACVAHLVDNPEKGGHYFTIWAPRQTGKTWLMRRATEQIRQRYGERFLVAEMSMQGVALKPDDPEETFLLEVPQLVSKTFRREIPVPVRWSDWSLLFRKEMGLFDRPLILLIDEFDKLPARSSTGWWTCSATCTSTGPTTCCTAWPWWGCGRSWGWTASGVLPSTSSAPCT